MNWKKVGVYCVFTLFAIAAVLTVVSAAETWLTDSRFYEVVSPYLVPGGMSGLSGIIIGIVTMIILLAIFLDILTLVTPFSKYVTWIIAVGFAIIAVTFKFNVTVASWIFSIGAIMFSWAGALAGIMTIILGILIMVFLFFGGQWIANWAKGIKQRRKEVENVSIAEERGADVNAAVVQAGQMIGKKKERKAT